MKINFPKVGNITSEKKLKLFMTSRLTEEFMIQYFFDQNLNHETIFDAYQIAYKYL